MTLHLPIGHLNIRSGLWSRYQDANPVSTRSLADDLAVAPLGSLTQFHLPLTKLPDMDYAATNVI